MNTPGTNPPEPRPGATAAGFDLRARSLYRQSLEQLPADVHARLRSARGQALASRRGWRLPRWMPTGLATTAVLAIVTVAGLQQREAATVPEAAPVVAVPAPDPGALAGSDPELALILDSLENNPDFYLWLASNGDVASPER